LTLLYFIIIFNISSFSIPLVILPHTNVVRAIFIKLPSISILLSLEELSLIDIIFFRYFSSYTLLIFGPFLKLACRNIFSFRVYYLFIFNSSVIKFNFQI